MILKGFGSENKLLTIGMGGAFIRAIISFLTIIKNKVNFLCNIKR